MEKDTLLGPSGPSWLKTIQEDSRNGIKLWKHALLGPSGPSWLKTMQEDSRKFAWKVCDATHR